MGFWDPRVEMIGFCDARIKNDKNEIPLNGLYDIGVPNGTACCGDFSQDVFQVLQFNLHLYLIRAGGL